MGKVSKLIIIESEQELIKLKRKQSDLRSEKRIECLLLLKSKRFATQELTAQYLGISRQTIVRWITAYNQFGIVGILPKKTRDKKSKIFTPDIHKGLASKMSGSRNPLLGYWDAQRWVKENYGVQVNYHWLRKYLIKHFKTKWKTPRKSHIGKDGEAEKAFLKTP